MQRDFPLGQVVMSTNGRDRGRYYIVVAVLGQNTVSVADGKYKLLTNPKRKNIKHLISTNCNVAEIADKLQQGKKINDQMIHKELLMYQKVSKEDK